MLINTFTDDALSDLDTVGLRDALAAGRVSPGEVREAAMARAQRWYDRYGVWSLLASWVPVIGDPLTVVAGLMRVSFLPFVLIVAFAKGLRYAVIAASALAIL